MTINVANEAFSEGFALQCRGCIAASTLTGINKHNSWSSLPDQCCKADIDHKKCDMFLILFLKRDPVCSPKPSLEQILVWFFTETGSKTVPILSLFHCVMILERVLMVFSSHSVLFLFVSLRWLIICLRPLAFSAETYLYKICQLRLVG